MEPWQALLYYLYAEGRNWAKDLKPDDWRKEIANAQAFDDPNVQIVKVPYEARSFVSANTTIEKRKGFVIAPGKYGPESLVLLVPVLNVDGGTPKLSLQVGVLQQRNGQRSFFGYRFESPEGYEEHNFYHAQPIQAFKNGERCSHSINWYPDSYPTFPLKARNAFDLVASMMLACRDSRHMKELANSQSLKLVVKSLLADFLEHLKPTQQAAAA